MTSWMWFGLSIGAVTGIGLWLIISTMPAIRSRSVFNQVALAVSDISPEAYRQVTKNLPRTTHRSLIVSFANAWSSRSPQAKDLERELARAGKTLSVEEFRARQITWSMWGAGCGLFVALVVGSLVPSFFLGYLTLPLVCSIATFVLVKKLLIFQSKKRMKSFEEQLPAVWEFLALSLAAGENLLDALRRMTKIGHGSITDEFRYVVSQNDEGVSLAVALQNMSSRFELPALSRGIEQILTALHRGTPVVAVLQAHAKDAREDSKRVLLEQAGQKEVLMLIPLVFLILPVTIIFAIFPGLLVIQARF